jgi:hypothetical protein
LEVVCVKPARYFNIRLHQRAKALALSLADKVSIGTSSRG